MIAPSTVTQPAAVASWSTLLTVVRSPRLAAGVGTLLVALLLSGCSFVPRGVPASEKIPNFGRVNRALFRGAQLDEAGLISLQRIGVRTIINLQLSSDRWPGEEASAHAHGLAFVSAPLRGLGAPTDAQVSGVLALIASSPSPVFIHCEHGADRTGMIIACYRMRHEGWPLDRALAEAKRYGFSVFQIGMRDYIREFSRTVTSPSPSGRANISPPPNPPLHLFN